MFDYRRVVEIIGYMVMDNFRDVRVNLSTVDVLVKNCLCWASLMDGAS